MDILPTSPVSHAIKVAWSLRAQAGSKSTRMNAYKIASAAIELADAKGLVAVTIRAVANRVELTPMGVYRHFASRDELLLAMLELAMGEPPVIAASTSWQQGVREWSTALLACYQAHSWLLEIPITGMPTTPNHIAWVEQALEILAITKLPLQRQLDSALLIDGRARQFARIAIESDPTALQKLDVTALFDLAASQAPRLVAALQQGVLQSQHGPNYMAGIDIVIHGLEKELEQPS